MTVSTALVGTCAPNEGQSNTTGHRPVGHPVMRLKDTCKCDWKLTTACRRPQ